MKTISNLQSETTQIRQIVFKCMLNCIRNSFLINSQVHFKNKDLQHILGDTRAAGVINSGHWVMLGMTTSLMHWSTEKLTAFRYLSLSTASRYSVSTLVDTLTPEWKKNIFNFHVIDWLWSKLVHEYLTKIKKNITNALNTSNVMGCQTVMFNKTQLNI